MRIDIVKREDDLFDLVHAGRSIATMNRPEAAHLSNRMESVLWREVCDARTRGSDFDMGCETKNERKMTVQDVLDGIESYDEAGRVAPLRALIEKLTPVSRETLMNFQHAWDTSKSFDEFRKAQNAEIVKCVELEVSELGWMVRSCMGMEPLKLTTELN